MAGGILRPRTKMRKSATPNPPARFQKPITHRYIAEFQESRFLLYYKLFRERPSSRGKYGGRKMLKAMLSTLYAWKPHRVRNAGRGKTKSDPYLSAWAKYRECKRIMQFQLAHKSMLKGLGRKSRS